MNKTSRLMLSLLIIVAMVITLAGCGVKQQAAEKKANGRRRISLWLFPGIPVAEPI